MNIADMIRELLSGKETTKGIMGIKGKPTASQREQIRSYNQQDRRPPKNAVEPQKKYPVPDFIKKAQAEPTKIADPYSMTRAQRKAAQKGFVKTGQNAKAAPNRFADIKDFYGGD